MNDQVSFVEARRLDGDGRGRWGGWELVTGPLSTRAAKRKRDTKLAERRADGEPWEMRVVTFTRARTYKEERTL